MLKKLLTIGLLIIAFGSWTRQVSAAAYSASDVIGQITDSESALFISSNPNASPSSLGFDTPSQTVIDTVHHRLFVTDRGNNRVLVFNLDSNNDLSDHVADYVLGQSDFKSNDSALSLGITAARFTLPTGIAYDAVNDRLFVGDTLDNRVLVFSVSSISNGMSASYVLGQGSFSTRTANTTQSGLRLPQELSYDSASKHLFVADTNNNRVLVFDVATSTIANGENAANVLGQSTFTASTATATQSSLSAPYGVAHDSDTSRLFVSDQANNRVLVFDVATSTIANGENAANVLGQSTFTASTSATTRSGLKLPQGLSYDFSNRRLFVGDYSNNRVLVFDVATSTIANGENAANVLGQSTFTAANSTAGGLATQSSLSGPTAAYVDSSGDTLLVSSNIDHRIMFFDVTPGTIANNMNAYDEVGQLNQGAPLYLTNSGSGAANNAPNEFGLDFPQGVALDSSHHRLFVADAANSRVLVYNLDASNDLIDHAADYVLGGSNFKTTFTGPTAGSFSTGIAQLEYDSLHDRLFVADSNFSYPRVLVFDTSLLSNGMNASYVLGQATFTSHVGTTTQSGMQSPIGVVYDQENNRLFVSDQENTANRVVVFDLDAIANGMNASYVLGEPDFTSASSSATQNHLSGPDFLAYDSDARRLFVADGSGHNRVMVFDVDPSTIANGENASYVIGQPNFTSTACNTTADTLCSSDTIVFDRTNSRLFVGDADNSRITVFDVSTSTISNGAAAIMVLGQDDFSSADSGTSQTRMDLSNGTNGGTYDPGNNRLYFTDAANSRIMVFDLVRIANGVSAGAVGTSYTNTFSPTGSQGSVEYDIVSGSLPPDLTMSSSGTISGTPTAASVGSWTFTVRTTDALTNIGTSTHRQSFVISIPAVGGSSGSVSPPSNGPVSGGAFFFNVPTPRLQHIAPDGTVTYLDVPSVASSSPSLADNLNQTRASSTELFARNLRLGMRGEDVRALQRFLNSHGFLVSVAGAGSAGQETLYFGAKTKAALKLFQEAHAATILAPENLQKGTGNFFFRTRSLVNAMLASGQYI